LRIKRLALCPPHGIGERGKIGIMTNPRDVVHSDPELMGGTPVFVGTRVPVQSLFDYLEAGDSLDEFLEAFPTVSREQAVAALEIAREAVTAVAVAH
jgi:uncharacterized protein (DUF433 family)